MTDRKSKKRRDANSTSLATLALQRGGGFVRILAGDWRRSVIPVPDSLGLRPTPERVRETVYDWLVHLLGGFTGRSVLDLFAGSCAMGLEAASRGAAEVDWVDTNRQVLKNLSASLAKFKASSEQFRGHLGDGLAFVKNTSNTYDVIFIDPPFSQDLQQKALKSAISRLKSEGVIYVESPEKLLAESVLLDLGLVRIRAGSAGQVAFELLALAESQMSTQVKLPRPKKYKGDKAS